MNLYGKVALAAVRLSTAHEPTAAWQSAVAKFTWRPSGREKACPREAFLGLSSAGLVSGIPRRDYGGHWENGSYAIKAVDLLNTRSELPNDAPALWREIVGKTKRHGGQMDVIAALWIENLLVPKRR